MFSNGVVTNGSWVSSTHHYGPVNWKECFAGQTVRNQSLQLLVPCKADSTPQIVGCESRSTPRPSGWNNLGFDDSRWEYAHEYSEAVVGWGVPPANCNIYPARLSALMWIQMATPSPAHRIWIGVIPNSSGVLTWILITESSVGTH